MGMKVHLALIGFGVVGQGFAQILVEKERFLWERHGLECRVVAISDIRKGAVMDADGLDLRRILDLVRATGRIDGYEGGVKGLTSLETIRESNADVVVEVTWTNLETGEPGLTHIRESLAQGRHVITTNKGPIALAYHELKRLADLKGVQLRFEGTVMSGTPVISLALEDLAGLRIEAVRGILNGTTNYILTEMERGKNYEEALREAQRLGYAEADPTMDVEGWDAVAKILILANVVLGGRVKVGDVERRGIVGISPQDLERARREGRRVKLIARAWREGEKVRARVSPEGVPITDLMAHVHGTLNALTLTTDGLGEVTIVGRGAGGTEAGYAILNDLIAICRRIREGG